MPAAVPTASIASVASVRAPVRRRPPSGRDSTSRRLHHARTFSTGSSVSSSRAIARSRCTRSAYGVDRSPSSHKGTSTASSNNVVSRSRGGVIAFRWARTGALCPSARLPVRPAEVSGRSDASGARAPPARSLFRSPHAAPDLFRVRPLEERHAKIVLEVDQELIVFLTDVLGELGTLEPFDVPRDRPRLAVRARIDQRGFVVQRIAVRPRDPLD